MRVLLIDDNRDINDMVCMGLEGQDISCKTIEEGKAGIWRNRSSQKTPDRSSEKIPII